MGELIQFRPRSKSDKPGRELTPIEQMAYELMDQTAPKELSEYVAPENDPA